MHIIGLNGRLHSGKDTAYESLKASFPDLRFERRAFADKLKLSVLASFGFNEPALKSLGWESDPIGFANELKEHATITIELRRGRYCRLTAREFMQWYGTEGHREIFGANFWVDALLPKTGPFAVGLLFNTDVLVVTDCRFPNEARRIHDLKGEVWNLDAEERLGPLEDSHDSEQPLPAYLVSRTVDNNGTVTKFRANLESAFLSMRAAR